jgi:hypothetical protein
VNENADNDQEKVLLVKQMIDRGEVHVLAIRHTEEVMLSHIQPGSAGVPPAGPRAAETAAVPGVATRHVHHQWRYDAAHGIRFTHRYCTHPGCGAKQRFVWDPESAEVNGRWVDEKPLLPQRKQRAQRKTKVKK